LYGKSHALDDFTTLPKKAEKGASVSYQATESMFYPRRFGSRGPEHRGVRFSGLHGTFSIFEVDPAYWGTQSLGRARFIFGT